MIFGFYVLISFLLGCIAMILCIVNKADIGIFFDRKKWPTNSSAVDMAMFLGYIFMFGFALCYWIYRFYIFIRNR